ncbi:MAG TPA: HAMP domain-containing sensor histidine kinase, partial [Acidimicrobiales bacterium]|nr:HAMP domain-containing sensor histidine kinase [Acidimicrobiales bacterium]
MRTRRIVNPIGAKWPVAIFLTGVLAAYVVGRGIGVAAKDTAHVVIESVVGAAAAGLLAAGLLLVLRRTRLAVQASIAALAPVAALAIGVTWATSNMFITTHDLRVLWVVLVAAGAAGMAVSLVLARRVSEASQAVGEMARALGESGPDAVPGGGPEVRAPGELAALAEALRDTSARLARAQSRAAAEESTRRELVAWVSHDLRTPLAGIRAMVEALEDGVVTDPADVARYYATIRLEADHLAGLVDDLFELSRIRSGSLALELEVAPVMLDELLSDAMAGATVSARAKGLDLRCEVQEPAPVVEVATAEMIRVVRNLLDNAIRHTEPGGRVTLRAATDVPRGAVTVSVLDGCGGIPDGEIERVFETGYRGDQARSPGEGRGG